jgi:hypothetical protein
MTSTEPTDRWPLRLIVAAVAVRLVVFGQYLASPLKGFHRLDQTYYLAWARRIAAGDWLGSEVFEQGPLYPYLLAIVFRLFGDRGGLILVAQMRHVLPAHLCQRPPAVRSTHGGRRRFHRGRLRAVHLLRVHVP